MPKYFFCKIGYGTEGSGIGGADGFAGGVEHRSIETGLFEDDVRRTDDGGGRERVGDRERFMPSSGIGDGECKRGEGCGEDGDILAGISSLGDSGRMKRLRTPSSVRALIWEFGASSITTRCSFLLGKRVWTVNAS